MPPSRTAHDALGTIDLPHDAAWGPSTERARRAFAISGPPGEVRRFPRRFLEALGLVKRACAMANEDLGLLPVHLAEWIAAAAQEVVDGRWDAHFPLDVYQTGSGTSTNMNANEVIASRSNELMGGNLGDTVPVHPNDHVNLGQSSNDVIPTVLHVAAATAIEEDLLPALRALAGELRRKSAAWSGVVKLGRTHLVDAVPMTLGAEAAGWASRVEQAVSRAARARDALLPVALGGTAVGVGHNRHPELPVRVIARLCDATGLPFTRAPDGCAAQGGQDAVVEASALLRTVAVTLRGVAEDVRLLASGPRGGFGELRLPAISPGSSIMPGKVNPVMPEMLVMVAIQVVGLDTAVAMAGQAGHLQLNTTLPLLAHDLLHEIELLANGARTFAARCVAGMEADLEGCRRNVERNLGMATALAPVLGYDVAASIAKGALASGRTVREEAALHPQAAALGDARLDELLDVVRMARP